MKNIELSIPGMQSAHCQTRVNDAIATIEGIKVEKLEAGKLSVSVESDEVRKELVETIERTGYKIDDDDSEKDSSLSSGCCTN
ncbi:heavy-metal-associated domain-containing protein [Chryseobacterium sp. M5A1_1a]